MKEPDLPGLGAVCEEVAFVPTRAAGLARLDAFVQRTGAHYARNRNFDLGPAQRSNVSALSPWIRHRLVTEEDVLRAVLARHGTSAAEKFIQEVFWRTYFKGWLEQRPSVWSAYQRDLLAAFESMERDGVKARDYSAAVAGQTGIDCFDAWTQELIATGYLHNHARMWFASIWIFTLRLPWQLGADFFMQHLLDADPASNTLSWRWVGGLHTKGKMYLARPDNIARFTEGRFCPSGLATAAAPLTEAEDHPRLPVAPADTPPEGPFLLALTEDDMCGAALLQNPPEAAMGLLATHGRSPKEIGVPAKEFARSGMQGALFAHQAKPVEADAWAPVLLDAAQKAGVRTIVTAYAPTGPVRARLDRAAPELMASGVALLRLRRPYDTVAWPYAKAGFFGLKKKIPAILHTLGLTG